MLAEYVSTAETSDSAAFSYLLNLLVADERRRHEFCDQLAESLRISARQSAKQRPVSYLDLHKIGWGELIDQTKVMLAKEREDKHELRRLAKELHDLEETTLWRLLVDILIRDTDKHIAVL